MSVPVFAVTPGSLADKKGVRPGDRIVAINQNPIRDVLDYDFYLAEERVALELETAEGKRRVLRLKKGEYDDVGISFETYLIDQQRSCRNNCIFCFVDQMPPGMRESLYFKDDDDRLSFLFGNYVTLTNVDESEIDRIIRMHISPINVSVHTTNPALRAQMMKNRFAERSLGYLRRLAEAGIQLGCQLVLCPGLNDGPELARTLRDLFALGPAVHSIACVPVGLTKYREGLCPLALYDAAGAGAVIDEVERFQQTALAARGVRLAYPADEFFLRAGRPLPGADYYGEFSQIENGVGMLALLLREFRDALAALAPSRRTRRITLATGVDAAPFLRRLVDELREKWHNLNCTVIPVENDYFGRTITVAGLVTGQDLLRRLAKEKTLGEELLLPTCMLRHEQDNFLDDVTLDEARQAVGVPVRLVENDGAALLRALTGTEEPPSPQGSSA